MAAVSAAVVLPRLTSHRWFYTPCVTLKPEWNSGGRVPSLGVTKCAKGVRERVGDEGKMRNHDIKDARHGHGLVYMFKKIK